mgnify:CR=1 FL=1
MKRYIAGMLIWAMLLLGMVGCGKQQQQVQEPEMSQMKAICELAVMECYYHNVAKFEQDGGHYVELQWWISRLFGKVYEEGVATIRLPSKV